MPDSDPTLTRFGALAWWASRHSPRTKGNHMKSHFIARCSLILAVLIGMDVNAGDCLKDPNGNVVCGKGQCAMDQYGKVLCAKEGGGAVRDRYGNVKCGLGSCATDDLGQVKCSSQPGGGATVD